MTEMKNSNHMKKKKYLKTCFLFLAMILVCGNLLAAKYDNLLKFYKGLYSKEPLDSPARFALNEIATDSWRSLCLLRGELSGSGKERKEAAMKLTELREQIEIGLKWPFKTPPSFDIPYTESAPQIDGNINELCWKQALSFQGCYPISSVKKNNNGNVWMIMWDKKYIYVGTYFPDANILSYDSPGHPYRGDSLEIFLMPSKRIKKYWEVVVGCDGDILEGFHCNNRYGGWTSEPEEKMNGLKFKASKQKKGFSIEAAIPFSELPNYMLGNLPKAGQTIYFTLVRTNIDTENGERELCSPFPFLYGGHNVFGYAKGILKYKNTDN